MVSDEVLFCTELIGLRVFDTRGRRIGRIKDAALVPIINPARVDRFLVGGGWTWLTVRYDQVQSISLGGIYLKDEKLTPYHSDEYMLRIVRDLLDQQIIDALGRKVVRVTDVTFQVKQVEGFTQLDVLEVDIGMRSIFRRLAQGIIPAAWVRKIQRPIGPNSISWEYCNIVEPDPQRRLRLNISNVALEKMHPADLADIVEELGPDDREAIIETLDAEVAAEALSEMDVDVQASIFESLETERAAEIIEEMSADEAAHVLAELEEETSSEILDELTEESKSEVSELIEYRDHTAGAMMTTEYVAVPATATVGDVIHSLRQDEELLDTLNTIFVLDSGGRPIASVPLARLFVAADSDPILKFSSDGFLQVMADESKNRVTDIFDKYNVLTLPVIDEERKLVGVITADDVISALKHR